MVGDLLRKKLLRDVWESWPQFAAAAAVVFCATALYVSFLMTYRSLVVSRDNYYEAYNFADFFVHLEKAPESALRDVEAVEGVWRARGRIVKDVPLEVEGNEGAVVGRIISMPDERDGLINDIHMLRGGYFPGVAAEEVIVNERFAEANALRIGDTFQATLNERKEDLRIVGTCYSPEYVYAIRTVGQFAPDYHDFGIIFARERFVEDAFDMTNAVNDVCGLLHPGANVERVLDTISDRLEDYGVYWKYGRDRQMSNRYLLEELKGVRTSARIVPMVFLIVAAVVIHIIVHRLVEHQRTQIGLLCALGYGKLRVTMHYISYALIIALAGTLTGVLAGYLLAGRFVVIYNMFFRFPSLRVVFHPKAIVVAFTLSCGMCVIGAVRSAWSVLSIQPAVAIRPAPPAGRRTFHTGRLSSLWQRLPLLWRITLRNAIRARGRSAFCILGVAVSMMMLVVGSTTSDFFEWIINYQFGEVDASQIRVDFADERPEGAALEIAAQPGVARVEGILQIGGELRNGWRTKLVFILGLEPDSRLYRVYDLQGRSIPLPPDGLLMPDRMAKDLDIRCGDELILDPYIGDKDEYPVRVRAIVEQYMGLELYADRRYLAKALGEGPFLNGAILTTDTGTLDSVMDRLDDLPAVSAVSSSGKMLRDFKETVAELINVAVFIQTLASAIIAFAVIYNASAVSIAEQERDLACLCSLGYERDEVARIATNDTMPLGLVGVLIGIPLAYLASWGIAQAFSTELYKLPVIVNPLTYARSALLVLCFLLVARAVSRRRVFGINIVQRLKTRE